MTQMSLWGPLACLCLILTPISRADDHAATAPALPQTPVALAELEALVLSTHPASTARQAGYAAALSRIDQAAALPNPELEAEMEDLATEGPGNRLGETTYAIQLNQPLELGGKRHRRRVLAAMTAEKQRCENGIAEQDALAALRENVLAVLAAQERLAFLLAAADCARSARDCVAERVQAGKDAPQELSQAEMELARQELAVLRATSAVENSRAALLAQLGPQGEALRNRPISGDLRRLPQLPPLAELQARLADTAAWQHAAQAERVAAAELASEDRAAIPDLTLSVGYSYERGSGAHLAKLGLSMPLPLFDRNRGNRMAALHSVARARAEAAATQLALQAELEQQWLSAKTAIAAATAIRDGLLPHAQRALTDASESHRLGRGSYLAQLSVQQAWQELNSEYVEALAEAHRHLNGIKRLIGQLNSETSSPSPEDQRQ